MSLLKSPTVRDFCTLSSADAVVPLGHVLVCCKWPLRRVQAHLDDRILIVDGVPIRIVQIVACLLGGKCPCAYGQHYCPDRSFDPGVTVAGQLRPAVAATDASLQLEVIGFEHSGHLMSIAIPAFTDGLTVRYMPPLSGWPQAQALSCGADGKAC